MRNDNKDWERSGFVAQDIQANSNDSWSNLIGTRTHFKTTTNEKGEEVEEVDKTTLTMDYARLVCVLWQTNKDMLKRIEILESKLNSQ